MSRSVFKIVGSVGPGGAVAILFERVCKAFYYEGYNLGDPATKPAEAFQQEAKKQRQEYVEALLKIRGRIERQINNKFATEQELEETY